MFLVITYASFVQLFNEMIILFNAYSRVSVVIESDDSNSRYVPHRRQTNIHRSEIGIVNNGKNEDIVNNDARDNNDNNTDTEDVASNIVNDENINNSTIDDVAELDKRISQTRLEIERLSSFTKRGKRGMYGVFSESSTYLRS